MFIHRFYKGKLRIKYFIKAWFQETEKFAVQIRSVWSCGWADRKLSLAVNVWIFILTNSNHGLVPYENPLPLLCPWLDFYYSHSYYVQDLMHPPNRYSEQLRVRLLDILNIYRMVIKAILKNTRCWFFYMGLVNVRQTHLIRKSSRGQVKKF